MIVLRARNVNDALVNGMITLANHGWQVNTRNGLALKTSMPVSTVTERPEERVLFHAWRDANPFFHLYESLWMLAGRQDVAPLARYVRRMRNYSDDSETFNAAYGYRWRRARGIEESYDDHGKPLDQRDQLDAIIDELNRNSQSRQCVLQIWDHQLDLGTQTKDHACNVAATFQVNHLDHLEMVVFCRSNDAIWGCHGANAVHFSMLQEYVARSLGRPMGCMTQVSVNYHAYNDVFLKTLDGYNEWPAVLDPYVQNTVKPFPLMSVPRDRWDLDCRTFVSRNGRLPSEERANFHDSFFRDVAWPIVQAHDIYKDTLDIDSAITVVEKCVATDWRRACTEWLIRRAQRRGSFDGSEGEAR